MAKRLHKFFLLERATIVQAQGASEGAKFAAKPNFGPFFGEQTNYLHAKRAAQKAKR
jgi:hypothetical protein